MKFELRFPFYPALCCSLLLVSNAVFSMSSSPEDEPVSVEDARAGKYGKQYENRNPEADARAAIEKGDLRLLGFASRVTTTPGVPVKKRKMAMETCGVSLMKGFGDVIRSDKELAAMRLASAYAKRYNAVILEQCLKKD
ncbi:MAG: hypothetical protein OEY06_11930 [Gammaproteobacteria bacterium]|nr:hypothetical protein [Gammaproteobacteria bacterium]